MRIILMFIIMTNFSHAQEILYKIKEQYKNSPQINSQFYFDEVVSILRVSNNKILTTIKEMQASDLFEFVELNTTEYQATLNGPNIPTTQWQHDNIESQNAWKLTIGDSKIVVAVCDSGVEMDHEDLKGSIQFQGAWDFQARDNDPEPVTSHGTFVAGLISAQINKLGGIGVAPGVKILPLRIATANGSTSLNTIAKCIKYAADQGAKVINVSFTGINTSTVASAAKYARQKGSLLVYSAGNQGWDLPNWINDKNILAVGATNINDNRWTYIDNNGKLRGSNIGPFVDLVAPGANVFSTTTYIRHNQGQEKYRTGSGTSYSAPIASAVAALIFSINPNFTPKQVEEILKKSADQIGDEYIYGAGRINAARAVELAQQIK